MASDLPNRVSALYHAALERPAGERSAFLRDACRGDDDLRREVELLLSFEPKSSRFLEESAAAVTGIVHGTLVNTRLGPYTIVASLGHSNMADVYRARDTKLGRDVVIKVLPPHLTHDPERTARFAREARVLATLSHPNIGAIFGVEEADGVTGLVLEFVEGETLEARLERGPVALGETLSVARQIAEALDAAHEKGIVHRDLKPANIVLQRTSSARNVRAKVLDFGLAKVLGDQEGTVPRLQSTEDGRILGTPAYMSPEQARGLPVDKRTDIWAFGCVIFEMLTGHRAFEGDTLADTIARILDREPAWSQIPRSVPDGIRRLLGRCLEKDPESRLHDISDARLGLEQEQSRLEWKPSVSWRLTLRTTAIGGLLALIVLTAPPVWRTVRGPSSNVPSTENTARPFLRPGEPVRLTFEPGIQTDASFSHDGRSIAYASNQSGNYDVWVRLLAGGDPIPVTKNAVA